MTFHPPGCVCRHCEDLWDEIEAHGMTQTQHSLIALELNRTLALSASWDEAAEALKRLDFDRYDRAMDAFWNNFTREAGAAEKAARQQSR